MTPTIAPIADASHKIVVNSKFTAGVFKTAFSSITTEPGILYPPINVDNFVPPSNDPADAQQAKAQLFDWADEDSVIILSINRFERKKNIALAVQALAKMKTTMPAKEFTQIHLVIAGKVPAHSHHLANFSDSLNFRIGRSLLAV
jgi:glycosyltransferase involved in cell wall biosynthesis